MKIVFFTIFAMIFYCPYWWNYTSLLNHCSHLLETDNVY